MNKKTDWLVRQMKKVQKEAQKFLTIPEGGLPGQVLVVSDDGKDLVWIDGPHEYFRMIVTSASTPYVSGYIDVVDNGDGTWLLTSAQRITTFKIESNPDITAIKIEKGDTILSIYQAFMQLTSLTSFEWEGDINLTNIGNAWVGCSALTSFPSLDFSRVTYVSQTWNGCSSLVSIAKPIDFRAATTLLGTFTGCTLLTSPAATGTPIRATDDALAGLWE